MFGALTINVWTQSSESGPTGIFKDVWISMIWLNVHVGRPHWYWPVERKYRKYAVTGIIVGAFAKPLLKKAHALKHPTSYSSVTSTHLSILVRRDRQLNFDLCTWPRYHATWPCQAWPCKSKYIQPGEGDTNYIGVMKSHHLDLWLTTVTYIYFHLN